MKKILFAALGFLFFASACSKDDCNCDNEPTPALITPDVSVRMAEPLSLHPFTGALEIYPCNDGSSIYYGNYVNGKLSVFYGIYTMWCSDNAYKPRSARTVSMTLKKHADEFGLEHDNHIQNALGKRVNGFWGIEALVAPPVL